jgi:O-antigen ligase
MSSTVRDRTIDVVIAGTLALLPLLPAGPTYFGWRWPWALEAAFLSAALLAVLVILTIRAPALSGAAPTRLQHIVARGYLTWLIPMLAATIIGLLARNPPDLVLFKVEADGLVNRLAAPMNQGTDPLYPLRVGVTVLEGGLMFLLLSSVLRRTDAPIRRAHAAIAGCLLGMTIVSVVAVAQYVTRANLHHYWVRMNPNLTRSHATLDDPNALASFLVLGIGLAAGVAWASASHHRRAAALVAAALACAALVTTVSRAGIAALAIAAVVAIAALPDGMIGTAAWGRRLRRAGRAAALAGTIAVVVWAIAFAVLPKRETTTDPATPTQALLQTVDPRESVATVFKRRHIIWGAAIHLITVHPVTGAGLGQFPRLLASYPGSDGAENAHNYFLQVFAEAGGLGFAGLLTLLAAISVAMRGAIRGDDPATRRLALGLSLGVLAFVLTWLTGHPLLTLSNQLWFAAVLAVGLAAADAGPQSRGDAGMAPTPTQAARALAHPAWIPVVVVITLAAAVPRAIAAAREGEPRARAAGVYGWEPAPPNEAWPEGTTFRWTRERAAVREPVRGRVMLLPVFMARPDIDSQPVVVDVKIAGLAVPSLTFTQNGWHVHAYDLAALLGEERWRSHRTVTVEFLVHPPVVPARVGPSNDTRELGIGLGAVGWSSRPDATAADRGD